MTTQLWRYALIGVLACAGAPVVVESQATQLPPATLPTGVITGRVIDEAGHPAIGFRVQAVIRRKKWTGPYYETAIGRADETDDRGQFRLHSLPPGQYVVAVSLQPVPPGSGPQTAKGPEYLRTFNPGTTSLTDAQAVDVSAAQEQSVSIALATARFVSVSGVATTSEGAPAVSFDAWLSGGPATVGFTNVHSGFMTTVMASARTGQDGSFVFSRVPPGAYTLTVTNGYTRRGQPLQIAEIPVEVKDAPLSGVQVATAAAATVSGRLEWADQGPAPWPRGAASLGRLRATAVGRPSDFASIDSDVKPDGTFQFTNLYGLRRIQSMGLSFNWTIQSVEAPGNVMVGQNLDVTPGRAIEGVKVFVTNRVGRLRGTVADGPRQSTTNSVLLMSHDRTDLDPLGWGFRATQTYIMNDTSYYEMDRVLPGSYLVVAIDVEPYRLTNDADLMERARAAATPVEVRQDGAQVHLRLTRLRPFVQDLPNR